jgi:hypothetical protein
VTHRSGDGQLWSVVRHRQGSDHTLAAMKSIRAIRPVARLPAVRYLGAIRTDAHPTVAFVELFAVQPIACRFS